MTEVERLHYVNGRRLDAGDLRLEQHYHIAMRRLLNRGLFTPGIVNGFNVTEASEKEVYVEPGLALDPRGREVVLPDLRTVPVPAQPATSNAEGYFLVVRYAEERLAGADPDCGPPISEAARIREEPVLEWTERPPFHLACRKRIGDPLDCGIVLALVRLTTDTCQISLIDVSVREFAFPANASRVTGVALEGEKDIDKDNPKVLHFHVRGGRPASVVLYIRGGRFSSLYYTEMGLHHHTLPKASLELSTDIAPFPEHRHSLPDHTHQVVGAPVTENANAGHRHKLRTTEHFETFPAGEHFPATEVITEHKRPPDHFYRGFDFDGNPIEPTLEDPDVDFLSEDGSDHQHPFSFALGGRMQPDGTPAQAETGDLSTTVAARQHSHVLAVDTPVTDVGSSGYGVRGGSAYGYIDGLLVALDGTDITAEILRVLPTAWGQLGDGLETHPLNTEGTGAIDLLDIARAVGKTIDVGPHVLIFGIASGGGQVLYNLYVE